MEPPWSSPTPLTQRPVAGLPASPPEYEPGPPFEPRKRPLHRRTLGPVIAAIVAFLAKFKSILLLLPKLKLLTTAGTMLVSLAAYAWLWGWPFAAGFVVLLFVHEMGHVIALRREGIKASAPMFIPFLGAVISARSLGDNAAAEARVGLAGPVLGSLGAAACILVWHATGNDMWRALAFIGFFLNLFNLIPLSPLDGGRAMAAMAPWMWLVGLGLMVAVLFVFPNPLILLFVVIGGLDSWRRWKQRGQRPDYYRVRPLDRLLVAAVYISLIALLAVGMHATNLPRTFG
jgi:Zn-dependent protease